ncbi:unnamed protein product [Rodentolepis nana]|uniref:Focal_AT domain-containing protein n=1 Tax=Rodentolepis nana TaxID=102285 RepID=A0A0R3TGD6_RODNA|nr:unnamed protein product [Rodentolepis nana]
METSHKDSVLHTPETSRNRCDATISPRSPGRERYCLGSLSPLHETSSQPVPPGIKTLHAPKANQVYTVPVARNFDSNRIDTLLLTLAEKLTKLRAITDLIASDIDYSSKLIRDINIYVGQSK